MNKLIFLILVFFNTIAQTSAQSFSLVHGKKTDVVKHDSYIELYYSTDNKALNKKVSGIFQSITNDSITLDMIIIKENKKTIKDVTKPGELYRFSVKDIKSMITVRRKFENWMKALFFTSLAGALVVSPLSSIENGKLNWSKVGNISGMCAIPAVLSITLSGTCWPKRHQISPMVKTRKLWTIEM